MSNPVPKSIDARFLSLTEREMIRDMVAGGSSMRAFAQTLGRSPSTIKAAHTLVSGTDQQHADRRVPPYVSGWN
ncbi:helix-turn-helix domain-containing protein, partial [Paenarthrobacter nitroguajacolicus]